MSASLFILIFEESMRGFFIKVVTVAGLLTLSIVLLNYFIDPLDIFSSKKIKGLNYSKPMIEENMRTWKAYKLDNKPEVIFLGTSRTHVGLDPSNLNFVGKEVFNSSLYTGLPYEYEYYFDKALLGGRLKNIILGLDFFAFYHKMLYQDDFRKDDFDNIGKYKYLLSFDILLKTFQTIKKQSSIPRFLDNGMGNALAYEQDVYNLGGHGELFRQAAKNYVNKAYSEKKELNMQQYEHLRAFEKILKKAYKNDINIILFISPSHARQWEALDVAVGIDKFDQWKRTLLLINEQVAADFSKKPFNFWDFSGYHNLTTEKPPPIGDTKAQMKYYWDASHYKKELGDIMLDRIFDTNFSNGNFYSDFGVLLDINNINEHLNRQQLERQQWLEKYPEYVEEFHALRQEKNKETN